MRFDILQNGQVIETKELGEGSWKVGRAPECDIQLRSPAVSKQHALLVIKGSKAAIVDLGSSNGVFVNGILVRKQRIEPEDEVYIANFLIRHGKPLKAAPRAGGRPTNEDGNAALKMDYDAAPVAEEAPASEDPTPQEKLLQIVDTKVLLPLYGAMKTADWRFILVSILLLSLVASVLLSVIPIVRWSKNVTTQEALARAQTILSQMARENYRILTKTNDTTRLTVEAAEAEKGILSAYIIDPKAATILAPTKLYNQAITDVYALDAIKKVQEGKQELISVQKDENLWIVAQPIYLFSQETNERTLSAIVLASFEIPSSLTSTFQPLVEAALFAIVLSLGAYFLIYKMVVYPINQMHEQVDAALKGDDVQVTSEAKLLELESLAQSLNFALSRIRQAGGGGSAAPVGGGGGGGGRGSDDDYVQSVQEFDSASSDALLLLDVEKKVRFVGRTLEDMLAMRNQHAQGVNITDACRDSAFAGTALELVDRVVSSLGESQNATLDINGVARNIVALGHRGPDGNIAYVLLTVKLGEG